MLAHAGSDGGDRRGGTSMSAMWRAGLVALGALLVLPASSVAQNSNTAEHNGLRHELQTDESAYLMYEPVQITYSVTNISGQAIAFEFPCTGMSQGVGVFDPSDELIWADPPSCDDTIWADTLAQGASYLTTPTWNMFNYETWEFIDTPGVYRVQGGFPAYLPPGYWFSLSVYITIFDASAHVAEPAEASWGVIKALYR
jgi:hypothetical protein